MKVDLKRLAGDATVLSDRRRSSSSGSYKAIRDALPAIDELRAAGVTWKAIAGALALQGVTQGKGSGTAPLSTTRLTAIVSDIRKKAEKRRAADRTRQSRTDLVPRAVQGKSATPLQIAPELSRQSSNVQANAEIYSEEEIRREQFDAVKLLLKN